MKTILAIDPGPVQSAYVLWDGANICAAAIVPNVEINLTELAADWLAIEMIESYGMAVGREVFETVFWIGRFYEMAGNRTKERISRRTVKLHICNSAKAKDTNIRQALIDRFGAPGTKKAQGLTYGLKADMWAAFALAVTAYDRVNA